MSQNFEHPMQNNEDGNINTTQGSSKAITPI